MGRFLGQVGILTGASGGIGAEIARRLADEGMAVMLVARSAPPLEALAERLPGCWAHPADVTVPSAQAALVSAALERTGRIDVLINNAGIETFEHFHASDPAGIAHTVSVNLTAPLQLCRRVLPHMLDAGGGQIVNISSTAGLAGVAHCATYSATKAGLITASRALRMEYADRNVGVSVLCPGFVHGGGMHERHKAEVGAAPALLGSTTTDAVADATARAITSNPVMQVLNSVPLGGLRMLDVFSSRAADALVSRLSAPYMRRLADARQES